MTTKDDRDFPETKDGEEWTLENEIQINEKLRKEDVEALKEYCSTLPQVDVTAVSDNTLVGILHSCDYDMDKARKTIKVYFEMRFSVPEVFLNRDVDSDEVQTALEIFYYCPLPRKTPEGYRVVFQGLRNDDISLWDHIGLSKMQCLTLECCIHENPTCPGYAFVCDMNGVTMSHMWKSNFSVTKKLMKYLQEGNPLKIQSMHMLNTSSFTYYLMRFMRPLLSKHLVELFHFYTADQVEEFWKNIPKECIPMEYGGDLPELNTFREKQIEWMRKMQPKVDRLK